MSFRLYDDFIFAATIIFERFCIFIYYSAMPRHILMRAIFAASSPPFFCDAARPCRRQRHFSPIAAAAEITPYFAAAWRRRCDDADISFATFISFRH
jgi:hypothetical protein